MLAFQPITPDKWDIFWNYYKDKQYFNAENSIANLCCYSFLYHGEYVILDNDTLLTRIHIDDDKHILYYLPLGKKTLKEIYPLIKEDAIENNYKFVFAINDPEMIKKCPDSQWNINENRDMAEYLYLKEDLATLSGKKYQPKRNHINQFKNKYEYTVKQLTKEDKEDCLQMLNVWRGQEMSISPEYKRDYDDEKYVIEYLFNWFDELQILGYAIIVDNKIIAFSLSSPINSVAIDTHIEKADRNYMGAYAIINKETAIHLPDNYIYINREEDKGIMGLRQAKLSYQPYKLIEKYICSMDCLQKL